MVLIVRTERERHMNTLIQKLWSEEEGQDLVEYALLIALIALAVTAGMSSLAVAINSALSTVASDVTSAVT